MTKVYVHETEFGKLEAVRRPKWFFDDGSPVSDEFLAKEGYFPAFPNFPDHLDRRIWDVFNNPVEMWEKVGNAYNKTHEVKLRPIEDIREEIIASSKHSIDEMRDAKLKYGVVFDVEGIKDRVQCSSDDINALTPLRIRAKELVEEGRGDKKLLFRTQSNRVVELSASSFVYITDLALDYGQECYKWSWEFKDRISDSASKIHEEATTDEMESAVKEIDEIVKEAEESLNASVR